MIAQRATGTVTILDLNGNLTLGAAADQLADKVRSLLQQGQKSVLVNLAKVSYVDSAGLGALVEAYATVKRQGGVLKLIGVNKKINDLLVITKLATVFELHDSEPDAVASFAGVA